MNMKALLASAAFATLLCAVEANATPIAVGSGWTDDTANALNQASENSPWTFSVPTGAEYTFSLTDALEAGDVYTVTVNGLAPVSTTFTLYPTTFDNNLGSHAADYALAWTDTNYSHLQLSLSAGDYSIVVKDISSPDLPASFGVRVDAIPQAIPEASTWAMLILGFAGVAFTGYRARRRTVSIA